MKIITIKFYCLLCTLFICGASNAQGNYILQLNTLGSEDSLALLLAEDYKRFFNDEKSRHNEIQLVLNKLINKGYLSASIDSIARESNTLSALVYIGKQFRWTMMSFKNIDSEIINSIGVKGKSFHDLPVTSKGFKNLYVRILKHCDNNGYPFALVQLDSVVFSMEEDGVVGVSSSLKLIKNKKYHVDSIIIKGDIKLSKKYIFNYLGIKPGDIYNEHRVSLIKARIKDLSFLKETSPSQVVFTENSAKLILYLAEKKASNFDGIAGLLPNSKTTGKLLITGDANLKLLNSFGAGELLALRWRSLQPQTQDLKLDASYPFLFSTPFGLDGRFYLYKRDTIYIDLISRFGIKYQLGDGGFLSGYITSKETRLLNGYTSSLPFASVKTNVYGVGYKRQKLNYLKTPTKGYSISFGLGAGNKKIQPDPELKNDTLNQASPEYSFDCSAQFYVKTGPRMVFLIGLNVAYINSQSMFANELFRIGGMKTLRGFDEESIFASSFGIGLFEYRYLIEKNTFLYAFVNTCYYEDQVAKLKGNEWTDTPIGYGAGFCFDTKAGVFSINYAIGQQKGNAPDFRSAKVHFGIVNSF